MGPHLHGRRLGLVVGLLAGLALAGAAPLAALWPQDPPDAPEERDDTEFGHAVKLPVDPRARRKIQEARRLVAQQEWSQAIRLLQSLLDSKEDGFLPDEANKRQVSIRAEANRLLGTLPREGRQFYELEFGSQARALLTQGLERGDPQLLAEVASRFQHTDAGGEATGLLGTFHLDQGQYIVAALCFERLLQREGGPMAQPPLVLFKAALAFERAGDAEWRDQAWAALVAKLNQPGELPLPPPLRGQTPEQLRAMLPARRASGMQQADWPLLQGRPDRAAQAVGQVPYLEPRTGFPVDITRPLKMTSVYNHDAARRLLDDACKTQLRFHQPIISGHHPLAVDDLLLCRGAWGLHAFNVRTGQFVWEIPMQASLAAMTSAAPSAGLDAPTSLRASLDALSSPGMLYENSMIGVLSSDRQFVYAVEDLAVPLATDTGPAFNPRATGERMSKWQLHNELVAYDLKEGLPVWVIGTFEPDQPFSDCFFLGAPLPLGDKLYVLVESAGEIRLLCMENRRTFDPTANKHRTSVAIVWSQPLCQVNKRLPSDPGRRLHTAQLSYGEGMLICPTNAGVILGVDLLTRSLVWAHAYQVQEERPRSEPQVRFPRGIIPNEFGSQALPQSTWGAAAPIVHRGHVIFTAPDAKGLHVLHLRDGSLVWRRDRQTAQQAGDLYLAGVDDDRVIVVGQKSVRALSLSNRGEVVWETNLVGTPGGRGVLSAGEFYLPLRAPDARDRSGGEIWTLNARTGEVRSRMRARPEALGNLIFVGGDLVTQGVTRLAVFPQLASKEREIAERLEANPTDPLGLAQSGELKLHRGDVAGAVADLRAALAGTWTDAAEKRRARDRLFDALCDLTDRRFAEQEQGLAELYELAEIPAPAEETGEARKRRLEEQTDRQVRVLRLVARGRETQSRFADALRVYLDFEAPSATLVQSPEEPAVQIAPAIWVQGRIRDLFERATPAQRAEMERVVADQWEEVRSQADGARLQRFADNYGPLLPEGRAALLLLADRLVAEQKFPEARLKLLLVLHLTQEVPPDGPDAVLAAQALDALGRLNLKQGLLEDAAFYFKQLATRFPKVKVRDGRTGEELYLDLATDKRFLPYLSRDAIPRRGLLAQPYTEITRLPQSPMSGPSVPSRYWATYASEPTPLFQRLRIGIDPALRQCRLVDVNSEADRGGFTLESFPTGFYPQTSGEPQRPLIAAHPLGQIVVLSWVNYLYAFDVVQGKLLWKHDLFGPGESPGSDRLVNLVLGPNGRFMLLHASRNIQEPVGALGVVTPRHIVITSRGGLVVLDPITKRELWSRDDVTADTDVFGDDQVLYLLKPRKPGDSGPVTQALRTADGVTLTLDSLEETLPQRLQVVGRYLLLKSEEEKGTVLRLHDPLRGRDVWRHEAGPNAVVLRSLVPELVGVATAAGEIQIVELTTGRQVFTLTRPGEQIAQAQTIYLLGDSINWYVVFNLETKDPAPGLRFRLNYNMAVMRSVEVNGPTIAVDRRSGQVAWQVELPVQNLILEQFDELPLLLCSSYQEVRVNPGGNNQGHFRQVSALVAVDKRDGRIIDRSEAQSGSQFFALRVDAAAGRIDLIGHPYKATYQLRGD